MPLLERTEPPLVTIARDMVAAGKPWRDVAATLVAETDGDREALADAALHWVRVVGRLPSDDFRATATLRALEAALAATPRDDR